MQCFEYIGRVIRAPVVSKRRNDMGKQTVKVIGYDCKPSGSFIHGDYLVVTAKSGGEIMYVSDMAKVELVSEEFASAWLGAEYISTPAAVS